MSTPCFAFPPFHLSSLSWCACLEEVLTSPDRNRIDVLINVAGVMDNFSSADSVGDDVWERVLSTNLTVPVRMMRAVLPGMKARRDGVIVNVASTAGVSGAVAGVAYTASKHGLVSFSYFPFSLTSVARSDRRQIGATKNVAWRFRNDGIRCNAVLPGAVDSDIGKAIASGRNERWDSESFAEIE